MEWSEEGVRKSLEKHKIQLADARRSLSDIDQNQERIRNATTRKVTPLMTRRNEMMSESLRLKERHAVPLAQRDEILRDLRVDINRLDVEIEEETKRFKEAMRKANEDRSRLTNLVADLETEVRLDERLLKRFVETNSEQSSTPTLVRGMHASQQSTR